MKKLLPAFIATLLSVSVSVSQTLIKEDYDGSPFSFGARVDSIIATLGKPDSIIQSEEYGGKRAPIVGDSVVGDETYSEDLLIYVYDSLTVCASVSGSLEYYEFTSSTISTRRGIRVGSTQKEISLAYGKPDQRDLFPLFSDTRSGEDAVLQYVYSNTTYGIAFFLTKGRVVRIFIGRGSGC